MPMQSVLLRPGVDIEMTPALNEAGISFSQLIRTKNGLTQTVGGWETFGIAAIPSTVRSLHAWQDITATDYLAAAATSNLVALTATSYRDITPQMRAQYATPDVSISSGSNIVTIVDANAGVTIADAVEFHTPVSIGNLLLQGSYPIYQVVSTGSYQIVSSVVASTTIASSGILPIFTTLANSALVYVEQPNHTAAAILGLQPNFDHATSVGGLTIEGPYNVYSVTDSTSYIIISPISASSSATVAMSSRIHFHYHLVGNQLITPSGGYGVGGYGAGGYGVGSSGTIISDSGTTITAKDWSQDNWGENLLSCPRNGPVYVWSPNLGYQSAQILAQAPLKNGGIFVSMPQQILVCWKSVQTQGNGGFNPGGTQDNLLVRWSDAQDYTNYTVDANTAAGSFHIPTGSVIRGGLQAPNYGVIWTDVDVWIMQYIGPTAIFNFTRAASGCGLIGQHAAGLLAGVVWWCGESNFYALTGSGVEVVPCTVWDFIFQNINRSLDADGVPYSRRTCCEPNAMFNEITWSFPSGTSTENDAYVKFNLVDKTWDYGTGGLARTAWSDVSVIGNPVGADAGGIINQHELGNAVDGAGNCSFRTGWWTITDGSELAFVDFVMPDFQWGTYGDTSASIQIRFFSADYPGDTPRTYGPYTVTQANQYITPRLRGRLMAMEVISASNNVFWRLGRIRFRVAMSGRR